MELRQLRYFVEVATCGTYVGAAQRLHMAEPGLWKQVQLLERELGVPLFQRMGRGVHLTSSGAVLLEHARALLTEVEALAHTAQELSQRATPCITIGCRGPHVARYLGPVLARFRQAHPDVVVRLHEFASVGRWMEDGGKAVPLADLFSGAVDLVMWWQLNADVDRMFAYEVHPVAVLPPGDARAVAGGVSVVRLKDDTLLFPAQGTVVRNQVVDACRAAGFEPNIASHAVSPLTRITLSQLGLGIPITADDAVLLAGGVVGTPIVDARGEVLSHPMWLYWRRGRDLSPMLQALLAEARAFTEAEQLQKTEINASG